MLYPKKSDQMSLIGSVCAFERELDVHYHKNGTRKWVRESKRSIRTGKVVGFGCNYNGLYVPKNNGYFNPDDCNVAHFVPSIRVPHIKVRIKGEGKSLKIHPADCTIIKE